MDDEDEAAPTGPDAADGTEQEAAHSALAVENERLKLQVRHSASEASALSHARRARIEDAQLRS